MQPHAVFAESQPLRIESHVLLLSQNEIGIQNKGEEAMFKAVKLDLVSSPSSDSPSFARVREVLLLRFMGAPRKRFSTIRALRALRGVLRFF